MTPPEAASSSGARPEKYLRGSQPNMPIMAVSLPGGKPSGMVCTRPSSAFSQRESKNGLRQTSSGVFPAQLLERIVGHAVAYYEDIFHVLSSSLYSFERSITQTSVK